MQFSHVGANRFGRWLNLALALAMVASVMVALAPEAKAANGDAADEFFFYRSSDGAYRFYDMNTGGSLGKQILGGTGYSTGWSSITAVDLDGDGQDEMFFYRATDGAFRYYDVKTNGTLGAQLSGGTGYSLGWDSITAVDLDGDRKDEFFFYRSTDGAYRYYKMNANGSLGQQLSGGTGYSLGWDSITAVDLNGDRKDEFFFYRSTDGAYRYYKMNANGSLGQMLSGGLGYSKGWSSITAVDLNGDSKDEFFFYRSTDGAYRYYKMNANGSLGTLMSGGLGYSLGWDSITAVNIDYNKPIIPPPPPPPPPPAAACENTATAAVPQCQALVALYNSTGGANWTDKVGWLIGNPCAPVWEGLTCTGNNVIAIDLDGNNLVGTLPDLTALTSLQELDLAGNALSGSITPTLGALTGLTMIDLSSNDLTGSIPVELGALVNLQELDLASNLLGGTIPAEFTNLSMLIELDLSRNNLNGGIPEFTGPLVDVDLSDNRLVGSIPASIWKSTLVFLDLSNQNLAPRLNGSIPAGIATSTQLASLDLSGNQLSGSIPNEFTNLTQLAFVDLNSNLLENEIPASLGGAPSGQQGRKQALTFVDLSNNRLGGAVPDSFRHLPILAGSLGLKLCSNIDTELGDLTAPNPSELLTFLETRAVGGVNWNQICTTS